MSVFALHIHIMVGIDGRGINTPLKPIRVIGNASQCSIWLPGATIRLGAVKLPFGKEISVELRDEKRSGWHPRRGTNDVTDASRRVAVEPCFFVVMVVFNDNGVGVVVSEGRRCAVPA